MNFLKPCPFPLICFLAFSIAPFLPRAAAQPEYTDPVLPPIDYHAEAFGTLGRWSIYSPTIPGWHYSLEQLGADGQSWETLPDGQFYGNGQQLKYFFTEGRLPNNPDNAPPPPAGTLAWQIRFISFTLTARKNGLSSKFRLQREPTIGAVPAPGWTDTRSDALPAMPIGNRTYIFQGWEDSFAKIRWNTEIKVIVNENAPPDSYSGNPSQRDTEKIVFDNVKWQLIGAITSPYTPGPPLVAGPKQIIRLRRTAIDTNNNGIPNWWELANGFPDLTAFDAAADDQDSDGLSTLLEYQMDTNPTVSDTDGDGLSDGAETTAGSDPLHFNMPTFTLVSSWRKVELTEEIKRPLGGSISRTAVGLGTGGGTSLGALSKTYSPAPASLPAFPWGSSDAAASTWTQGLTVIPQPLEPLEAHDLSIPLYSCRMDRMHGDGDFINVNLTSEECRDIKRNIVVLERTIRVKSSRPMKTPWSIPFTRRVSAKASRGDAWSAPAATSGTFTFSAEQTYSDAVTLNISSMGLVLTPIRPGRTRLNTTSGWNDPIFTTEAETVEWLTVDQFSTSSTNLAYDNDQDGVSNELELKIGTDPNQRNSDGSGYADGDQLNQGVLPPPDGLVMTTRQSEYQYSPEDLLCPGHPANRLAVETDIPVVNYVQDPNGAKLDVDSSLQGALAAHGQFPTSAPVGAPMPLLDLAGRATAKKYAVAEMVYLMTPTQTTANGTQVRAWGTMCAPPSAPVSRPFIKIRTEQTGSQTPVVTVTPGTFEFDSSSSKSTNYIELIAKRTATGSTEKTNVKEFVTTPKFKLRDVNDVFKGWDDTSATDEPWTSVGVMKTNNIVKLVAEGVTTESGLELVVDTASSSYLSLSNQTITGPETSFTITGIADSQYAGPSGAKVILRKKNTTEAIATLHVHVLAEKTVYFQVYHASDHRIANSALPNTVKTVAEIKDELNSVYNTQANIKFIPRLSDPLPLTDCYQAFPSDGIFYFGGVNGVSSSGGLPRYSYIVSKSTPGKYLRFYIVKHITKKPAAIGFTISNISCFINSDASVGVFAHEAGHAFLLSTKAEGGGGVHDNGPGPGGIEPLMSDNKRPQTRWLRFQDWRKANTEAGRVDFQ